eukprot:364193-Chlamydomonas_euryale.AAC.3
MRCSSDSLREHGAASCWYAKSNAERTRMMLKLERQMSFVGSLGSCASARVRRWEARNVKLER